MAAVISSYVEDDLIPEASFQQPMPRFNYSGELAFLDSLAVDEMVLTMDKYLSLN